VKIQVQALVAVIMLSLTASTLPFFKKTPKEEKFLKAAEQGKISALKKTIKQGVDVNERSQEGNTALILAAANNHPEVIQLLLSNPAIDVNMQNNAGKTALILAATKGYLGIVELLLGNPTIDLNIQDFTSQGEPNWTALMLAAMKGYEDIVRLLITHGADVNKVTARGHTALTYAVEYDYSTIVALLLEGGADASVTIWGETIVAFAKRKHFDEVLQVIKDFIIRKQKLLIDEGLPKDLAALTVELETGLKG